MPNANTPCLTPALQAVTTQLNRPGFPIAQIDRLISVIIPVANEAGNVAPLIQEITTVLEALPVTHQNYEIIIVDDHSTDSTRHEIQEAMRRFPTVRLIGHQNRYGKSQAIWTGLRHARGEWIITMDGDGQNDPADIPNLLEKAFAPHHPPHSPHSILVSGVRVNRAANNSRRLASRFANWFRRILLNDDSLDTGCALKLFRRDAYLALPYFDNMHRYEPALFKLYNHDVMYVPVHDRIRRHGASKYTNFKRALDGIADLFGMMWLQHRLKARTEQSIEIRVPQQTQTAQSLRREHA